MFKVNDRNTRKRREICSRLTIKILEQRHLRRSGVLIVNFEHISHLFLVFLLLTLNMEMFAGFVKVSLRLTLAHLAHQFIAFVETLFQTSGLH